MSPLKNYSTDCVTDGRLNANEIYRTESFELKKNVLFGNVEKKSKNHNDEYFTRIV